MKKSLIVLCSFIYLSSIAQSRFDLPVEGSSYYNLFQEQKLKESLKKGCLVSYSVTMMSKFEYYPFKTYGAMIGRRYLYSQNYTIKPNQDITDFSQSIEKKLIEHFEKCEKIDVVILGHGSKENNTFLLDILERNKREDLLGKVRLVFSSGCGDAQYKDSIEKWLKYAKTCVGSERFNITAGTLSFMSAWKKGSRAIDAVNRANSNILQRNSWEAGSCDGGKWCRAKFSLFGDRTITINSEI